MAQDPYHKHPLDTIDKVFEIISILIFIVTITLVIRAVSVLPDIVPCHFKFNGEVDRYGSKYFLWIPVKILDWDVCARPVKVLRQSFLPRVLITLVERPLR